MFWNTMEEALIYISFISSGSQLHPVCQPWAKHPHETAVVNQKTKDVCGCGLPYQGSLALFDIPNKCPHFWLTDLIWWNERCSAENKINKLLYRRKKNFYHGVIINQ